MIPSYLLLFSMLNERTWADQGYRRHPGVSREQAGRPARERAMNRRPRSFRKVK